jgi:hypothetical protein
VGTRRRGDGDGRRLGGHPLIQLLNIIGTPLKSGVERADDDVSLFLLNEFVVQVQASEAGETVVEDVEERAEEVEEQLVEVVEDEARGAAEAAKKAASTLTPDE